MNWLSNLRVSYKIVCMIVITVIALATVSWTGVSYLQKTQQAMNEMASRQTKAVQLLGDASVVVRSSQARVLENVNMTDPTQLKKNKKNIGEYMDQYEKDWQEYKALGFNAEQEATIEANWKTFRAQMEKMLDLSIEGKQDEARVIYNTQAIKAIIGWDNAMQPLRKDLTQQTEDLNAANSGAVGSAVMSMLIQTLITLVILCAFGWMLIKSIVTPLQRVMAGFTRLGDGDFRDDGLVVTRTDEFGEMASTFADMRHKLAALLQKTHDSSVHIASASEELTASSEQSAQASQQVAQSVQQASDAVMAQQGGVDTSTQSVKDVAAAVDNLQSEANKVAEHANAAYDQAVQGGKAIKASVEKIRSVESTVGESAAIVDKLGNSSQEIGQIVETISGIAEQTNLLALNAAIEAARAGEQGRGFSVVADEVRKLAEASQEAAQQISQLIQGIQQDTGNAVTSMREGSAAVAEGARSVEELHEAFEQIKAYVNDVSTEVANMAEAIRGVAGNTSAITGTIGDIDSQGKKVSMEMESVSAATEEQSASSSEIATASDSLAKLAQDLQNSLSRFRF
ncbi:MAG: methyl-accepting chemotaxis protein [Selenomonadaceae bacterium]|nr:methyl-accepting chemotaxis protein [Selenomonadaceae bacterium]MDY3915865.1 methyl-accepting chemotaxis protein [Selenomonadaceae bacterium]